MRCAQCGAYADRDDNFCHRCGLPIDHHGLPTVISSSLLPVPWSVARGTVMRGVAVLVAGTVVEIVRREMARRVVAKAQPQALSLFAPEELPARKRGRFPWSKAPKDDYEVTVTVVQRRVRFFRR